MSDLLDVSRIRAGALSVEPAINAADDLIGAALIEVAGTPGAERIEVTLPTEEAMPVGRFDFVHALRALVNLLTNALEHTPVGTAVEVVLVLAPDELVEKVSMDDARAAALIKAARANWFAQA